MLLFWDSLIALYNPSKTTEMVLLEMLFSGFCKLSYPPLFFALSFCSNLPLFPSLSPPSNLSSLQGTPSAWRQCGYRASARTRRMKWWAASWTSTTWRASSTCCWWPWASACWSLPGNTCSTGNYDTPSASLTNLTSCWASAGWDLQINPFIDVFLLEMGLFVIYEFLLGLIADCLVVLGIRFTDFYIDYLVKWLICWL